MKKGGGGGGGWAQKRYFLSSLSIYIVCDAAQWLWTYVITRGWARGGG